MSRTLETYCPVCEDELSFDFGGIVSGPGISPYPEVGDLMTKTCDCELTDEQVEAARTRIIESYGDDDGSDYYFDMAGDR